MSKNMMLVFFDTEFTELGLDPRLISIGLVGDDGHEFYAELSDTYEIDDCNDFVREAVIPHLQGGESLMTMDTLVTKLKAWIEGIGQPVRLVTDSISWDWPWIQEIFYDRDNWPQNLDGKPLSLAMSKEFNQAVERQFRRGSRRHHALDDAKANRLASLAAVGNIR
ncbi:3'-5' exoribonuclease domain-containing protein [Sulfuriferula nivalis]|uniref:3'-5' exoribonuclease Rv2179c-like domain-containing protein n=1 Tax=Sulfuriferula nivalis TaxID=2675298 RepID=A0A809RCX4_9PROT|nr:3'-5' exoribonuclease [Sulfuriferula nivalis]BBO99494.1 hypothetical protein SFSGTM_02030 [Sulfuriferula nivalis]